MTRKPCRSCGRAGHVPTFCPYRRAGVEVPDDVRRFRECGGPLLAGVATREDEARGDVAAAWARGAELLAATAAALRAPSLRAAERPPLRAAERGVTFRGGTVVTPYYAFDGIPEPLTAGLPPAPPPEPEHWCDILSVDQRPAAEWTEKGRGSSDAELLGQLKVMRDKAADVDWSDGLPRTAEPPRSRAERADEPVWKRRQQLRRETAAVDEGRARARVYVAWRAGLSRAAVERDRAGKPAPPPPAGAALSALPRVWSDLTSESSVGLVDSSCCSSYCCSES